MTKRNLFQKNLGIFSKVILLCNVIAVLFLLLSYAASFINPKTIWPLAFFGLGYLPILLVNIGFVIYWLLRKPKYALFTLIPVLGGWSLLTQHMGFRSKEDQELKTDSGMRVMTFNAHLFQVVKKSADKDVKNEVLHLLKKTDPDVVCFQEYFSKIKGTKQTTQRIKKEVGFKSYYFEPAMKSEHEGYGQIIFSKFPIVHSGVITKNEYGINRIIFADIVKNRDTIRIYNVHLRSFGLQSEDKEFIQNPSTTPADEHATRRVGRKLKYAFERRGRQAEALRAHIDSTRYPVIVMGDFNDTPMSYSVNLVGRGLRNTFKEKGQGWGVTHYEMLPLFQIDYILCSKKFAINRYHIIKEKLSDHYPVWADIELEK
ncbi:endonuclease/exonuclease/phosphatase family protein [Sphingobacterium suaedae]|uniref:Endonuclease/exonuclease/phosphatase family protein n=1 Tax=Sphingobacterium suaedae TaxID=1686402 RepID=A0ABW5KQX1_9SPHI